MQNLDKFSFSKQLQSFVHAFNGLRFLIKEENNAKIHTIAGLLAVVLGFMLDIRVEEWLAVLFSIALVISLELVNTAIENMCDFICPEKDDRIKKIKDMSAGAVLWASIIALIIGVVIFVPRLYQLII